MSRSNQRSDDQRVVVTGIGVVTAIGQNPREFYESLAAGRSGITRWKHMDDRVLSKVGGDMSDFDFEGHLTRIGAQYPSHLVEKAKKLLRVTPLPGRLVSAAALQAYVDSGLESSKIEPERFGHVVGGSNLNLMYVRENSEILNEEPEYIDPMYGLVFLDTDVVAVVSELLCAQGPSFSIGGACASGNYGLIAGLDLLRAGRADAVMVSGAPQHMDPVGLQGWAILGALGYNSFNDEPQRASRPFDALREGFIPSAGAGVVVLETLAGAQARGAHIHAEVLGGAMGADGSRLAKTHAEVEARVIRTALKDARVNVEEVDYVNAHAASTKLGDATEVAALKLALGQRVYEIPVNSTKSMVGHCTMAAGVVEFIATVLQMQNNFVHPTINQEVKDPELDLDFVPNKGREYHAEVAISDSFGLGGMNACVVVGSAP